MRVTNPEHFKKVLEAKGFTHDHVIDVYTHPNGEWYHVGNDGHVRRISPIPHIENDPAPQQPAR